MTMLNELYRGNGNDGEFQKEVDGKRVAFDKKTGKPVRVTEPKNKPESVSTLILNLLIRISSKLRMQARENSSWPSSHGSEPLSSPPIVTFFIRYLHAVDNPPNPSAPDVKYDLEYVYGYRCADSRQNVFFNSNGEAVYMTAALGVILNFGNNTQKFFGGGQVANTAKNVANDENAHTDDIMALQVSSDKKLCVSGQVGPSPAVFVWDSVTGLKKGRAKLAKGARGVNAVAMSGDQSLIAVVDLNDSHNVYLFDANTMQLKGQEKGDTNKIFDIAFSAAPGDNSFCTVGSKHCKFWDTSLGQNKGVYAGKGEASSFACVAYDDKGTAYTGAVNSSIYVWPSRTLASTIPAHKGGFICAMRFVAGKLYSGGKDGNIVITNTTSLTVENTISLGGVLIRAIDIHGDKGLIGMRDGTILTLNLAS
jgi:WD40 repeat protein